MTADALFAQDLRDDLEMAPDFVHAGAKRRLLDAIETALQTRPTQMLV